MYPTRDCWQKMLNAIGASTNLITTVMGVALVKTPLTPGLDVTFTEDDEADFGGYSPLAADAATRIWVLDPDSGNYQILVSPPAGGWRWVATSTAGLPQTIYGAVCQFNHTAPDFTAIMQGTVRFDPPIVLTTVNDTVLLPECTFDFRPAGLLGGTIEG